MVIMEKSSKGELRISSSVHRRAWNFHHNTRNNAPAVRQVMSKKQFTKHITLILAGVLKLTVILYSTVKYNVYFSFCLFTKARIVANAVFHSNPFALVSTGRDLTAIPIDRNNTV
jgi:hypothetical protein